MWVDKMYMGICNYVGGVGEGGCVEVWDKGEKVIIF